MPHSTISKRRAGRIVSISGCLSLSIRGNLSQPLTSKRTVGSVSPVAGLLTLGHNAAAYGKQKLYGPRLLATRDHAPDCGFAATALAQQPGGHRPLPQQVLSEAPGMHPFGKGRQTVWGIRVYDATLWIVGLQWSANAPHALDIEPGRAVPAETLVKNAIAEMRDLKVGDESKLRIWKAEMRKVVPSVKQGDQVVIFCSRSNQTLVYFNDSRVGEIDDPSFCPAVMSVWLHPETKHQAMRKALLRE